MNYVNIFCGGAPRGAYIKTKLMRHKCTRDKERRCLKNQNKADLVIYGQPLCVSGQLGGNGAYQAEQHV